METELDSASPVWRRSWTWTHLYGDGAGLTPDDAHHPVIAVVAVSGQLVVTADEVGTVVAVGPTEKPCEMPGVSS